MASRPPKSSPPRSSTPTLEGTELWRQGVLRLIDQGRVLWMLGEGINAALTAQAQGWVPGDQDILAAQLFSWVQQAWSTVPRGCQLNQAKPGPVLSRPGRNRPASNPPALAPLALLKGSLSELVCPVLWMGSREVGGEWASIVLAVGVDGRRRILSLTSGSVREQGVAERLVTDLGQRGFAPNGGLLVITEGSRSLDGALSQVAPGQIQIAHCRTRMRNEILGHFPEASREKWRKELDAAWSLPVEEAAAFLQHLERCWASENPGAAERLERSRDASLVVARLEVSAPLKEILESAGSLRMAFKQALRWAPRGPGLEALTVGLPAWLQRTRRLVGWRRLELLAHRLRDFRLKPENNAAPQA